jgi:hypothetical protein
VFGRPVEDDERLGRPAFRFARPRAATVVRGVVAAVLVAAAALVLAVGSPASPGPPVAGPGRPGTGLGAEADGVSSAARAGRGDLLPGPAPPSASAPPVPPPGMVGVPLVVAVSAAAEVLRPGDRIDVLTAPAVVLAEDVLVLAVLHAGDALGEGTALYVAAPPAVGRRLAGAAPDTPLTITVRPP